VIVEVIGPYPPCVRCHRTYKLIRSVARDTGKEVEVKHIYAGSPEAEKYGKIVEAELFAEKMGVGLDYRVLFKKRDLDGIDRKLAPFVEEAKGKGILLTPVVVVNGQVKIIGRVPSKNEILELIKEETRENRGALPDVY